MASIQRDEQWTLAKKKEIREAFKLFDKDNKGQVIQEEAPTIMRYLGVYPSEKDIVKEIIPAMMEEDMQTKTIAYDKFEAKMLEIISAGTYEPDSEEKLLQAFRFLDPEGKGYIEASVMRDMLITKGVPFREKEIDAFMAVAKDLETGRIYHEDYVALLCSWTTQGS
mmetsp:Transcript_27454/g.56431  ORF Transcript_27454/g.56431 Transcript_27454/m.56431 type:complete len:167 (-) Transcript_27454:85-585(-)|eukprot:CAMPEP_0119475900 /NCGR_PEP_ID=MMETSP1344-20130328/6628_1 /TAXON_ID=236787 /ORGANISM="Florenciella parvula, Strain CCMP2471" /LENGTH=166 /DNA_ID=CAMNT_0007509551 /DNA_START=166 /DNA_END=666 /DNA_ORIENTATION=-